MKTNKNKIVLLAVILVFGLSNGYNLAAVQGQSTDSHPEVDFTISCVECHQTETPQAVSDWQSSKHGLMNFGCYMCHGDGGEEFYAQPGAERCISCHSGKEADFSTMGLKNCFDCHTGHTLKFHK